METKVNFTLVGLFVLVLGAAGIAAVLWLAGAEAYRADYDTYYAYMTESVSGLNRDAPVKYRGVDVGRVHDISLVPGAPDQVRLVLDIREGTPIRQDTVAVLRTQGLTGIAYVELSSSDGKSAPLKAKPGEDYPVIKTGPSLLVRLDNAITTLLAQLTDVSENINALLSPDNRTAIREIMQDLQTVSHTLATQSKALDAGFESAGRAMDNAAKAATDLSRLAKRFEHSADAFDRMTASLTHAGENANDAIDTAHADLNQFGAQTLPELHLLITELRDLAASVKRTSDEIGNNPRTLIFGRPRREPGPGEQ